MVGTASVMVPSNLDEHVERALGPYIKMAYVNLQIHIAEHYPL